MILISKVQIEGFRSIRKAMIEPLDSFTTFAGLNNSGKSNVLRALNGFFTGQTDEGVPLDVDRDYFRPDIKMRKAKTIRVSVTFSLPTNFKFRKGLENVSELLSSRTFIITKQWKRKESTPKYFLDGRELNLDQRQLIEQFLQLIKFRYIPNRVMPIEVIRKEHQALRDVLVRRLGNKAGAQLETFDTINRISRNVIKILTKRIQEASPDIGDIRLATPTSWSDMIFALGYRLGQAGVEIDDELQGAGIQCLLMIETLYLIDRDYFQKFGWRQAAIWAIEEPESSLHTSLEARIGAYLAGISNDPSNRLQILCTTHSDLMLQFAKNMFIVEKKQGVSNFNNIGDAREAIDKLSREGVSRWRHPLLYFPLDPLILVEGKYDAEFLEEAFKLIKTRKSFKIRYLEELAGGGNTGGVDALFNYLKSNKEVLSTRQPTAPVLMILDWDSSTKVEKFKKLVPAADSYQVISWPPDALNPLLGRDFHGIERLFSDRIITKAIRNGAQIEKTRSGKFVVIDKDQYSAVKQILNQAIRLGLRKNDIRNCISFLNRILSLIGVL
jgi:hypothetical protein